MGMAAVSMMFPALRAQAAPVLGSSLWLDAADASTFTFSSGNVIQQWRDKSGNNFHVSDATVAEQPTRVSSVLNGLPVVRFDGINDQLFNNAATPFTGGVYTTFVVLKATKPTPFQGVLDATPTGPSRAEIYLDTNGIHIFRGGGGGDLVNGNYASGDYIVMSAEWNTSASIWIDGTNQTTGALGTTASSANILQVGNDAGGAHFSGDIAEILIYPTALSAANRQANEQYLTEKWLPEPAMLSVVSLAATCFVGRSRRH
jgi:hypothetical protein